MEDFYLAVHRGDSPAAHRLLPEVEAAAVAYHPSWDWQPLLALCARDVDALDSGQRPEELPPELIILGSMWMGEPAEDFELLTGLGFNRSALRLGERWPVQAALGETSRNIGEATGVESDIDPLDHVLKAALYLAKGDVDLRADPLTNVSKKVRRRQRRESLAELPQAEKDRLKPRGQRKLGFDPYDPGMQDKPTGEALTTSEVLRDKLQAALPYLRPAERQAVLEAWDAARQDVPLPRYWGDAYQRKFKALQRASKRTQGMGSAS